MNMLGSHWRWRVVLTVAVFAIVAMRQLRTKVDWGMIDYGGPPVITIARGRYSQSIEAWDPSTGQSSIVAQRQWEEYEDNPIRCTSLRDGKAIAFVEAATLHVVETVPPHRETVWKLPEAILGEFIWVRNISPDDRFGVIEVAFTGYQFTGTGRNPGPSTVYVVELATQRIVSEVDDANVLPRGTTGEYVLVNDPQGHSTFANFYRRLNEQGEWVDSTPPADVELVFSKKGFVKVGGDEAAQIVVADTSTLDRYSIGGVDVLQMSPTDDRFLVRHYGNFYIGDLGSARPLELKRLLIPGGAAGRLVAAWFQSNGDAISFVDSWGDVFQLELGSNGVTKVGSPGSYQYRRTMGLAVGLMILGVAYGYMALSERSLVWALADAVAIAWIVMGIVLVTRIAHQPLESWRMSPLQWQVAYWNERIATGILFACLYVSAWYWAYGQGTLSLRLAVCIVALVGVAAPFALTVRLYSRYLIPLQASPEWLVSMSVAQATPLAVILSLPRWFGWRYQTQFEQLLIAKATIKTFGLASLFTVVACVAVSLAVDRAVDLRRLLEMWYFTYLLVPFSPTLGVLLPLALTLQTRSAATLLAIATGLVVEFAVIATAIGVFWLNWSQVWSTLASHLVVSGSGVLFVLLLPCLLLRRHGYRWCRASNSTSEPEQVVAAA